MDKVPESRFNIDAHYHENNDRPGSFAVKGGYFLNETCREFDPTFFNISPIEAMWMDPQQRKLLEVVYETFESAGVTLNDISGSQTAVFVACFTADAQQMAFKEPAFRHALAATGVDPGIISNRVSHVFNLHGPSAVMNTACSSSLYAIHNACNALRNQECSAAVVGGVNLVLTVDQHMNTAKLGVLSKTSTCHTFDAAANGYGRAEGVGAVYLKRLSDAIRDGDPTRGIVRSSATNYNGRIVGAGITTPNIKGQEAVVRNAYLRGGDLDVRLTGFFECHGPGTAVGDPLEVEAVSRAMNQNRRPEDESLIIGSVKTNVGHGEAVSGLSALIKAVLAVERGIIPPTRGVRNPSPAIDWKAWKVKVSNDPILFPSNLPIKRVSVNAFGYGGTNAHVVIESADSLLAQSQTYKHRHMINSTSTLQTQNEEERRRPHLLAFSAHDGATLRRNIKAIGGVAANYQLLDVAYTLANRRTRFSSGGMIVSNTENMHDTFSEDLQNFTFLESKSSSKKPVLGFVFTGQGAQWARMGAELMTYYPSFVQTINLLDATLALLEDAPEWTIKGLLLENAETSRVNEAEVSQPLCTAVQIAMVKMLRQLWNVTPKVCVGHSSGEIAAAFTAGLISSADAIVAAYYRGKVMRDLDTQGAMLAVGLGADNIAPYLKDVNKKVVIACHNSPSGVTLSGDEDAIERIRLQLEADNIFARVLKTNGKAYHSHHMKAVSKKYEDLMHLASGKYGTFGIHLPSDATMVSTVYNKILPAGSRLSEKYWSDNLLSPVLFSQAIQTVATSEEFCNVDLFIEIGPHSALAGPVRQIKAACQLGNLNYLPSLIRNTDSAVSLLKLAGELFLRNYEIDMARVTGVEESTSGGKVLLKSGCFITDLPTYQWDKTKEFSAESRMSKEHRAQSHMRHDILGSRLLGASKAEPTWRNILRLRDLAWLRDHSLGGEAVFPTSGYFSMAMEAVTQINEQTSNKILIDSYTFRDVSIKNALVTPDDDNGIEVIFNMRPSACAKSRGGGTWWDFHVSSIDRDGVKDDHMAGSIAINNRPNRPIAKQTPQFNQRSSGKAWNQALRSVGFDYGPTFQGMDNIRFDGKTYAAAATTKLQTTVNGVVGESRHVLHPACVDTCLQLCIVAIYAGRSSAMLCGAVPTEVDEVTIWAPTPEQLAAPVSQAYSWVDKRGVRRFEISNQLVASDGEVVMEITDIRCTSYEGAVPQSKADEAKPRPYAELVWKRDADDLLTSTDSSDISIVDLVELLEFKNPGIRVVDIHGSFVNELLSRVPEIDLMFPKEGEGDFILSLKANSFDLVISSSASLQDLTSCQPLLAANGRAVFVAVSPTQNGPLQDAGFAGIEKNFGSFFTALPSEQKSHQNGHAPIDGTICIVHRDISQAFEDMVQQFSAAFRLEGYKVIVLELGSKQNMMSPNILMLADLERPLLVDLNREEFLHLQRITSAATSIVWATAGDLMTGKVPEYNLTAGFTRSLRTEEAALNVTTVDFDHQSNGNLVRILSATLINRIHGNIAEQEYCVSGNEVFISRIKFDEHLNSTYCLDENSLEEKTLEDAGPVVGKIQNGRVIFEADKQIGEPLGEEEVEIEVRASGLNKEGVMVVNGTELSAEFSHEISGVVSNVGKDVTNIGKGDFVFGFSFNKLASVQRVPQYLVQIFDDGGEMCDRAGLPMAFGAASYALDTLANISYNESLLILPGSGLTGNAAVQIAKSKGARPYIGVQSAGDLNAIAQFHKLPREQIVQISMLEELRSTSSGVFTFDVIFSSATVEPTIVSEVWRYIAPFGRFVDCGRRDSQSRSWIDSLPNKRGANYFAFDMMDIFAHRPQYLQTLMKKIGALYTNREIVPLRPQTTTDIGDVNTAVAKFEDGYTSGKKILLHKPLAASQPFAPLQVIPTAPSLQLRPDVTYMLVGCLGGLGRSLTSWMMSKGARTFMFLSRSGTDSRQAATLVDSIRQTGAAVIVVRGDVSVKDDVKRAVASVDPSRPIRGVIHAAMVLRVRRTNMPPSKSVTNKLCHLGWAVS